MLTIDEDLKKLGAELSEYALLDNTESGEVCVYLVNITDYYPYLSEVFKKFLKEEISDNLAAYKRDSTIVNETIIDKRKIQVLKWNDE